MENIIDYGFEIYNSNENSEYDDIISNVDDMDSDIDENDEKSKCFWEQFRTKCRWWTRKLDMVYRVFEYDSDSETNSDELEDIYNHTAVLVMILKSFMTLLISSSGYFKVVLWVIR